MLLVVTLTIVAGADLSLHIVLSETTRGLVGEETFAALPPGALVVNTVARWPPRP